MKFKNVDNIEFQWRKLHLIQWINTKSTAELWSEIAKYRDASGENPFKELVELAKCLLVLPWSNGEVERAFSQMNIVKNSHRNRLSNDMTNSILTIRSGLRRMNKCCHDYELPTDVIGGIGTLAAYRAHTSPLSPVSVCSSHEYNIENLESDPDDPLEI